MTHFNIYGKYEPTLNIILDNIISQIKTYNDMEVQKSGEKAYEHLIYRVKNKDSMLEKCTRKTLPNLKIIKEKDYIKNVKPNGYRSYHLIVEITAPYEDILGNNPGKFFAEIQVRTIAMDSWASLEHQMKYKHDIKNPELIVKELKRCADELAACDVSMQTIRNLINTEN